MSLPSARPMVISLLDRSISRPARNPASTLTQASLRITWARPINRPMQMPSTTKPHSRGLAHGLAELPGAHGPDDVDEAEGAGDRRAQRQPLEGGAEHGDRGAGLAGLGERGH